MNYGYNFNPMLLRNMSMPINASSSAGIGSFLSPSISGTASKITFSGIINGASKTLGVINQAIPVFYQIKPIWNNAKTMMRVFKGINETNTSEASNINITAEKKKEHQNAPTFFD